MYRIRRENGEEVNLGSIDEFGAAVAAGVVTAKAEIFHARAEKWLPIASHPHFKMANDRLANAATSRQPARAPGTTATGPRPAGEASGQRPAVAAPSQRPIVAPVVSATPSAPAAANGVARPSAPQLRVVRTEGTSAAPSSASVEGATTQKPAPRWNSAQRPAARATAPKPSAPSAASPDNLHLVRADALVSSATTAPALDDVDFELLPSLDAPAQSDAASVQPPAAEPMVVHAPEPVEAVVEHAPTAVELVSHEEKPASTRGEVEIINPDRTMPVVSHGEIPALEIPASIQDFFSPMEVAVTPARRSRSKMPLFVGLGLAAAAAVIGFLLFRPSSPAAPAPATARSASNTTVSAAGTVQPNSAPASTPSQPVAASAPTGASTGLGGDIQTRKATKSSGNTDGTIGDGLEPPPVPKLPAAAKLGAMGDAAVLPTVESGTATLKMLDRAKALERQRRLIDSTMRQ